MTLLRDIPLSTLQFYLTAPYPCSYLPGQSARSQVATPSFMIDSSIYTEHVQRGFRRSGTFTYRPRCDTCHACVPARIPVADFIPNRTQRRIWRQHAALITSAHPLEDKPEYFELYQRYQAARHLEDDAEQDSHEQYRNFLLQSHVDSILVEFREGELLRMVSIIDILRDGISSVYTFYEPGVPHASYGTYNILWQAGLCRELGLPYLYLGYWIKECRKMTYKSRFRPLQGLVHGIWQELHHTAEEN